MALRTTENSTSTKVPPNFYEQVAARILSAKFGPSSNGNDMITLVSEILEPKEVVVDGMKYDIEGQQFRMYVMFEDKDGNDVVGNIVHVLHPKLGLPSQIDDENPDTKIYPGIVFDMMLGSKDKPVLVKDPENPKKLVPKIDPDTKKPILLGVEWNPQLDNIIGLSKVTTNRPY